MSKLITFNLFENTLMLCSNTEQQFPGLQQFRTKNNSNYCVEKQLPNLVEKQEFNRGVADPYPNSAGYIFPEV